MLLKPWNFSAGKRRPKSVAIQPTVASMATRPCFSSASRHQYTGISSVMAMGSKPFSPPTHPFSVSGYRRKGTAGDIGALRRRSSFLMETAESARAPASFHPPSGMRADQPGLVMSGSEASIATARRRTPAPRSRVAQRSVSPTMQMGMSLMMKSRFEPNQPSEPSSAMGDLPNVPSCHMRPRMATIASRPLLRSTVCLRSSSAPSRPWRSSVPKPRS
mmetsp:Transcript_90005/g.275496  ORF Transcript_90005/g.275496 Transcript_90005/m.275496 type:complete len:218 (+) Transcript_90005:146-799(+)